VVVSKLFMGEKTSGVMPLLIPPGMRAMSVPVDEVADIAGFVAPHTHVDILVAVSGTGVGESSFSRIVLQNIEVLAVAQEIEHVKDEPQVVKVVTLLVTPPDAEKLTLASREGTLRLAMRNYSDNKIIATNGVAMLDLMHNGAAPVALIQPQSIAAPARAAHLNADGRTPLRVDVMRDGKSSEAISFLNSGKLRRANQARDNNPASATPPGPAAARAPDVEAPVSNPSTGSAASLAGTPENAFAASRTGSSEDRAVNSATNSSNSSMNRAAPINSGEQGYQAAPKTYVVP
jgi:hypothetical protein